MPPARRLNPEKKAQELLDRLNIRTVPVPVERIARSLGAELRLSPLDDELSGMIFIKDGRPIIGVNALHHPHRQRFTIGHEIGHLQLHPELITEQVHVDKKFPVGSLKRDGKSSLGVDDIEIQANRFSAALLIPREILEQALTARPFDIEDDGPIEELARRMRVSKQALQYRITNL